MNPLEIALEHFFNQYRYTAGHFDFVEEADIFIAEEVLEYFFSHKRFTYQESSDFLADFSKIPRIQAIMIFKMRESSMVLELETQYRKFKNKKLESLQRVHRKTAIETKFPLKTLKTHQHKVVK